MPSGTLANQLALRALAGAKRRVIVPETSHIYNDTGDACQTLSALTLLPLAPGARDLHPGRRRGGAGADRQRPGRRPRSARSPSRARCGGCRARCSTGTKLAASRRWPASAASACTSTARGCSSPRPTPASRPADYAAPFDTVYVSLWKYFNCGQRRDPRRPAARARRHVPHPPDVRRQPGRRLAGGAGRPPLHGRVRRAAEERGARCPRRSIARSARIRGWRSSGSPTAPT